MKPLFMHFPTKLDENINLLSKNARMNDLEKGTMLLCYLSVHADEIDPDQLKYGESVASSWVSKAVYRTKEEQENFAQQQQRYGRIRALVMNGVPSGIAQNAIDSAPSFDRFDSKALLKGYVPKPSGFKCRDCTYIAKTSDDSECFEHTKATGHNTGFDLLK